MNARTMYVVATGAASGWYAFATLRDVPTMPVHISFFGVWGGFFVSFLLAYTFLRRHRRTLLVSLLAIPTGMVIMALGVATLVLWPSDGVVGLIAFATLLGGVAVVVAGPSSLILPFIRRLLPDRPAALRLSTTAADKKRFHKLMASALVAGLILVCLAYVMRPESSTSQDEADIPMASQSSDTIDILFVGNSLTFGHDMPQIVEAMARSDEAGPDVHVKEVVGPGYRLIDHIEEGRAMAAIERGGWEYVVLQENSWATVLHTRQMHAAATKFHQAIRGSGARTVLFMPWQPRLEARVIPRINVLVVQLARALGAELDELAASADFVVRRVAPDDSHILEVHPWAEAYLSLAASLDAQLAPVGLAWQRSSLTNPLMALLDEDGNHSTELGAYLTAAVFYATLFGQSPVGLPDTFELGEEGSPEAWRLMLTREAAARLQKTAWDTCRQHIDPGWAPIEASMFEELSDGDSLLVLSSVFEAVDKRELAAKALERYLSSEGRYPETARRALERLDDH